MRALLIAVLACLLLLIPAGCKEATPTDTVMLGQGFQVAIGETVVFSDADLKIKFTEVIEDSRCPADVVCIWAGKVSCLLDVTINNETKQTILTQPGLSDMYDTEQYRQYTMQFQVEPYPMSGAEIKDSDYRLWLTVTKAP